MSRNTKNELGRSKQFAGYRGEGLNFHQLDLNKPLTKVSLGLFVRGVEMVHIADSYESFQPFKLKLCTIH